MSASSAWGTCLHTPPAPPNASTNFPQPVPRHVTSQSDSTKLLSSLNLLNVLVTCIQMYWRSSQCWGVMCSWRVMTRHMTCERHGQTLISSLKQHVVQSHSPPLRKTNQSKRRELYRHSTTQLYQSTLLQFFSELFLILRSFFTCFF